MTRALVDGIIALAAIGACGGIGNAVLALLDIRVPSRSERIALSVGLGVGLVICLLAVLGSTGFLYPQVAWLIVVTGLVLLAPVSARWLGDRGQVGSLKGWKWDLDALLLLCFLGVCLAVYGITSLAPTLEGDSVGGYLLVAREYAQQHALVPVDYAYVSSYPQNGQVWSTLGFLLRGQVVAQLLVSYAMGVLCLIAIYALGRSYVSRRAALMGMAIWYGAYSVAYLNASGKIDLAWAFFELVAILAFCRWYFTDAPTRQLRWLVLAGFFLGMAGGVKQSAVFATGALLLGIALRMVQSGESSPRRWIAAYGAILLPASLALVWLPRTYLMIGELAYTGSELPGDDGIVGFFRAIWGMSMLGNSPGGEGPLGKPVGPAFLAVLPFLAVLNRVDRRIWHFLGFFLLVLLAWYFGVQRARHLLPALGVLSLVTGYVVVRLRREHPWLGRIAMLGVLGSLSLTTAYWSYVNLWSIRRLPYVVGIDDELEYLERNLAKIEWYPNYQITSYVRDQVPLEARIAALSTRNSYYLNRPFYAGWTQNPANDPHARELLQELERERITHVFINDFVVDRWGASHAWLLDPGFKDRHLTELISHQGQHLYVFTGSPPGES